MCPSEERTSPHHVGISCAVGCRSQPDNKLSSLFETLSAQRYNHVYVEMNLPICEFKYSNTLELRQNDMKEERLLLIIGVLLGTPNNVGVYAQGPDTVSGQSKGDYNPCYWVEGVYNHRASDSWIESEGVVALFDTDKPVFIQSGSSIPSGADITPGWKTALEKPGIDGTLSFRYGGGNKSSSEGSLPGDQEEDLPYTGYYKNTYLRFTGSDVQRGTDLRAGTVIPSKAISGTVYCSPNRTYGRGPYIVGKNNKYVVTATALNWEVAYPISDLLSGAGILPSSNVWGISGRNVTALLAIETTELEIKIPGLANGATIHVVVWDKMKHKKSEETVVYQGAYTQALNEYDFILIDKIK